MMDFVRNVEFKVKDGKAAEFGKVFTAEVLPMLKTQTGFKHELAMVNGTHAIGLSVWKDKASADLYQLKVYPDVLKKLTPLIDGTPRVETFELAATTLKN